MRRLLLVLVVPVLVVLAVPAAAPAKRRLSTLRGLSDQNQPVLLRVDRRRHRLRARFDLLVTSCRGSGGHASVFGAPRATTVKRRRWLRLSRSGRARTNYLVRRRFDADGDRGDGRLGTRVVFRARLSGRKASGTLRVRTSVREAVASEDGVEHRRFKCDSRTRRWRAPRIRFSGPWRPTRPLTGSPARYEGAHEFLAPLSDGRVLVAGGDGAGNRATARAELFRPGSNRWQRVQSMRHARTDAAIVRLADGRVLVAGGGAENFDRELGSAEVFSPRSRRWSAVAPMHVSRLAPAAALLSDGRVLVAGSGAGGDETASAELYDPLVDEWAAAAPLPGPSGGNSDSAERPLAAPLAGNRVLVVNGGNDAQQGTFTVYDAGTNSWSPRRPVPGFSGPGLVGGSLADGLVALSDGRVLAVGACGSGSGPAAAIFGPSGWRAAAPPPFCARGLATLPSGRVLAAGDTPVVYDPARNTWTAAPRYRFPHPDSTGTASPSANLLAPVPSGALLVSDGLNRYSSAERFVEP